KAKAKVEEERKRREAEEAARRKEQDARDHARAAQLIEQGKQQLAKQQFDAALTTLGLARQLQHTPEVDKLLTQASEGKSRVEAQKKGEQAKAELEKKLAEQKGQRDKAEAEAKAKQQAYLTALEQAQKALVEKRYAESLAKYQEADKLFHTDAVISGLKQAKDRLARADVEKRQAEEQKRAEAERQKRMAEEQKRAEADKQKRLTAYQSAIKAGRDAMSVKNYDEAIKAFTEGGRQIPGDRDAATLLRDAEKAKAAAQATADAEMRRKESEQ